MRDNTHLVKSVMLAPRRAGKTRAIVNWLNDGSPNPHKRRVVITPSLIMVDTLQREVYEISSDNPELRNSVFSIQEVKRGRLRGLNVEIGFDELNKSCLMDDELMSNLSVASGGEGISFATMTLENPLTELFKEESDGGDRRF